nr:hypothetical protein [Anaerolineae bacterium]
MTETKSNPHYQRLVSNARKPSLRATFWIGFGLALALFALALGAILRFPYTDPMASELLASAVQAAAGIVLFIISVITAVIAAVLTGRDRKSEAFQLLLLTGLSSRDIVDGYVRAALYRVRVLFAVQGAVIPVLIVGAFAGAISRYAYPSSDAGLTCYPVSCLDYPSPALYLVGWTLAQMIAYGGVLASTGLGAALGVSFALSKRLLAPAPVAAFLYTPVAFVNWLCGLALFGPLLMQPFAAFGGMVSVVIGAFLVFFLPPVLLVVLVLFLTARRLSRHPMNPERSG